MPELRKKRPKSVQLARPSAPDPPPMGALTTFKGGLHGAPHMAYEALDFFDVDALLSGEGYPKY